MGHLMILIYAFQKIARHGKMVILSYEVSHSSGRVINVGGNFLEALFLSYTRGHSRGRLINVGGNFLEAIIETINRCRKKIIRNGF